MKTSIFLFLSLTFMLLIGACGISGPPPMGPISNTSNSSSINYFDFSLLISAKAGEVYLKRDTWSDFYLTSVGTPLYRGDQLRPMDNARAVVLCSNLSIWIVSHGVPSGLTNGCPLSPDRVIYRGVSRIWGTRAGNNLIIPYVISPRKTFLLSNTPTLSWNTTPGASSYTVRVVGRNHDWETEVSDTQIIYPGNPPLVPGTSYRLIVEADNGRSSEEEAVTGLGFSLLNATDAERVKSGAARLANLRLPEESEAIALSYLYAEYNLFAEAIEVLEALAADGSSEALVYRKLGEFYLDIELNRLAESNYLKALERVQAIGDIEGMAEVHVGLAGAEVALGKTDEAIHHLREALAQYIQLEDIVAVKTLRKRLAELN